MFQKGYNTAINELQSNIDLPFGFTVSDEVSEIAIKALEEIKQYRAIGTIEEFKALKEKNEPKKPIRNDECTCPSCGTHNEIIKKRRNTVAFDTVYCWHCGQALEIRLVIKGEA